MAEPDIPAQEPAEPSGAGVDADADRTATEREFEYLFRALELYTKVQVDSGTLYHHRTSLITLTQGLLLLVFQALLRVEHGPVWAAAEAIAIAGLVLSVLWLFFEQRNYVWFRGRNAVLEDLERELVSRAASPGLACWTFWTRVPEWVEENAKWYERAKAPVIQHTLVPALFVVLWVCMAAFSPSLITTKSSADRAATSASAPATGSGGKAPQQAGPRGGSTANPRAPSP